MESDPVTKAIEADIQEILERSRTRFNEIIYQGIKNQTLLEAVDHVQSYWLDGIRPALIQYSYEAVCSEPIDLDPVFHFFSISGAGIGVHDDIIDKTSRKHNRDTVPGLLGADTAITTGDLLIVKGLTGIRDFLNTVDSDKVSRVLEEYERFFTEMCNGEIMEIQARKNLEMSLEDYHRMLWMLGVDTEACCKIGAIIGGGSEEQIKQLALYGRNLGYLNRLLDETADLFDSLETLHRRLTKESIPLMVLYSVKESEYNHRKVSAILGKDEISNNELTDLIVTCIFYNSIDYILEYALTAEDTALKSVEQLQNKKVVEKLSTITSNLYREMEKKCERFTT